MMLSSVDYSQEAAWLSHKKTKFAQVDSVVAAEVVDIVVAVENFDMLPFQLLQE